MTTNETYRLICLYGHSLVAHCYESRVETVCVNCGTVTKTEPVLSRASDFVNAEG